MEMKKMIATLTSLMALTFGPVFAQVHTEAGKVDENFHICTGAYRSRQGG